MPTMKKTAIVRELAPRIKVRVTPYDPATADQSLLKMLADWYAEARKWREIRRTKAAEGVQ